MENKESIIKTIKCVLNCTDKEFSSELLMAIDHTLNEFSDDYGLKVPNQNLTPTESVEDYLIQLEDDNMKEIKKDERKFREFLKLYKLLVKYDLDDVGYMSPTKDIVITVIVTIEQIAQKYNLYGDEWKTHPDYLWDYVIPRLEEFFNKKEDDKMNIEEQKNDDVADFIKIDKNKIRQHFTKDIIDEWTYDTFLEKWININTDQSIEEYLYENLDLILDPNKFVNFTSILLLESNLNDILDNLTDVELLSTVISKKEYEGGYKVYVYDNEITITPKQWRQIVYVAVERFIRRE